MAIQRIPPRETLEARIGETVKSRYRLTALVGVGGQGAVYKATDLRDHDEVAVKVLHREIDRDPASRERLLREAQALMVLSGTAVVQVLDQGFTTDGRLCLVTELLVGEDLESNLTALSTRGQRFHPPYIPTVFAPIAATLDRAHALGIVHRDLKPENVFLETTSRGLRVRLMDFGFAKFARLMRLTLDGFVAGSPSYIAPETWLDKPATPSVDVYGLAAMMFRTLAGRPPFPHSTVTEIYRLATTAERPSLVAIRPDLPPAVDGWVRKALAIEPEARHPTAGACFDGLVEALGLADRGDHG